MKVNKKRNRPDYFLFFLSSFKNVSIHFFFVVGKEKERASKRHSEKEGEWRNSKESEEKSTRKKENRTITFPSVFTHPPRLKYSLQLSIFFYLRYFILSFYWFSLLFCLNVVRLCFLVLLFLYRHFFSANYSLYKILKLNINLSAD